MSETLVKGITVILSGGSGLGDGVVQDDVDVLLVVSDQGYLDVESALVIVIT